MVCTLDASSMYIIHILSLVSIFVLHLEVCTISALCMYIVHTSSLVSIFVLHWHFYVLQVCTLDKFTRVNAVFPTDDNARERIVEDGFESMNSLICQYEYNIESFQDYLKTLNKTFNQARGGNNIYFSPPAMSQFIGVLFY